MRTRLPISALFAIAMFAGATPQFSDGQKVLRLAKIVMADGKEMFLYGRR